MRSAVVVGAGMGGLAVAGALARTGWQVTLLEQSDRLRADPAAILLWPNGAAALRTLGLAAGLDSISWPVHYAGLRRRDGNWLVPRAQAQEEHDPKLVHCEDLHDALIAGLGEGIDIRTGVTVRGIGSGSDGRAAVSDGSTLHSADLIVAADGADSAVRARLSATTRAVSSGYAAWRAVIPWYRASHLPTELITGVLSGGETVGSGYRFRYAALGERGSAGAATRGGIYWTATAHGAARPEPAATQLALLRRWFDGWHAPIGDLLAAAEPGDLVQHDVRLLRPGLPRYWYPAGAGGFVLLGDAAHAMPHHLGQGACLAFEDAVALSELVRETIPGESLRAALDRYDRARRPRATRLARLTDKVGTVLDARGRFGSRNRDAAISVRASRFLDRVVAEAVDWRMLE